jgi:outer membrane biosynthesis protein TonB
MRAMPFRASLLTALLLSVLLLVAGAAHGAPALPGLQVFAAEEEEFEAEAGEEEETEEEGEEGEEESEEEVSKPREHRGKKSPAHRHKKACRKPAARKHHCKHRDRQGGGFNSR